MSNSSSILVSDKHIAKERFSVQEMVALADLLLPIEERVPTVQGEAFDLPAWYRSWKRKHAAEETPEPTHVQVEAADEFQATIPWLQAGQSLFLYAEHGEPLKKGFPIRLYVPDGSSECLNVKSIIKVRFLHDETLGDKAVYGFMNKVALDELKLKK